MSRVVLGGLTKVFAAGKPAVDDIHLEIAPGELLVVLGANGSGKTTLLRLIAGLERPTRGTVSIAEREVTQLPPHLRSVGLIFQEAVLEPAWTVREHLAFPLSVGRGAASGNANALIHTTAEELGLQAWLDRPVGELSGGQQQRTALGRAMIRRPAVLLLDEPFANLDPGGRWELRRQLRPWLQTQGTTAVHVTHDAVEAQCLADRIAVLDQGKLLQVASSDELRRQPASLKVLQALASWPVNVVELPQAGVSLAVNAADVRLIANEPGDWPAKVVRVAKMGREWLAEFRWHLPEGRETTWWALLPEGLPLPSDRPVQVRIADTNQHWFESATGQRTPSERGNAWLAANREAWKGGDT